MGSTQTDHLLYIAVLASVFGGVAAKAVPPSSLGSFKELRLVEVSGVAARLSVGAHQAKVVFDKREDLRRLLALEMRPVGVVGEPKALVLRCRLSLTRGAAPRPAVVVYDRDGEAWFKVRRTPVATGAWAEERVSLRGLRKAAFSRDASRELRWNRVEKVWIGLAIDGPAAGAFELSQARFTNEPYHPTHPLRVTGTGPGTWTVSKDKAAKAKITTPREGPNGRACMKAEFTLPGGRHMYMVPSTPVPNLDLEGYGALRFKYRARLPEGLKGILVLLIESDGAQYWADPMPPPSEQWKTVTIPLKNFKLGRWSRDPEGRLRVEDVSRVAIGTHGTPSGTGGDGVIAAADIEFVP